MFFALVQEMLHMKAISAIKEDATNAVSQVIECLVPERARLTLWSTVPPPGTQQRRDANLSLDFGELPLERSLQQTWLANREVPVEWWLAPLLNIYLSKATKIRKRAAEPDPMIPEAIKSKKGHTESDQRGVGILFWTFFSFFSTENVSDSDSRYLFSVAHGLRRIIKSAPVHLPTAAIHTNLSNTADVPNLFAAEPLTS